MSEKYVYELVKKERKNAEEMRERKSESHPLEYKWSKNAEESPFQETEFVR